MQKSHQEHRECQKSDYKNDSISSFNFINKYNNKMQSTPTTVIPTPTGKSTTHLDERTNTLIGSIELLAAFNHFDKNSDGFLSRNQFGDLLSYLGFNIGKSRVSTS